jgi:hypothetical protein
MKGTEGGEGRREELFYHRDTEGTEFTETKREKGIP